MPQILPFVAGALGATALQQVAVGLAVGLFTNAQAKRKARKAASRQRAEHNAGLTDRTATVLQESPPWRIPYGRCIGGGSIVAQFHSDKTATREDGTSYTKPDGLMHLVIEVASCEIEDVHEVYIDGVPVGPTSSGWATTGSEFHKTQSETRRVSFTGSVTVAETITAILNAYDSTVSGDQPRGDVSITLSDANKTMTGGTGAVAVDYTVDVGIGAVRWSKHLGTDSQTVDTYLNGVVGDRWGSNHRLQGHAHVVLTLDLEDPRFQGGPPQISFDKSGRKLYDPRTGSTAYSNNPALIIRDWLTHEWGYGCDDDEVDDAYVIAAANACDAVIDLTIGGVTTSGATYTCNGEITTDQGKEAVLEDLAECMAGHVPYGAQWMPIAGVWTAPVMDLTDDDLHGQIEVVQAGAGIGEVMNGVRGTYIPATIQRGTGSAYVTSGTYSAGDTSITLATGTGTILAGNVLVFAGDTNRYLVATGIASPGAVTLAAPGLLKPLASGVAVTVSANAKTTATDFQPYQNATFLADDGEALWHDVALPFTDNKARAANLARIRVESERSSLVIRYPAKLKAWPLRVGDRVTVTSAEYGFTAKEFRVTDWQFAITSPVLLTLQEDAADIYDLADAVEADPTPNTGLPSPWNLTAITGLTVTSETLNSGAGAIVPRLLVEWDAITGPYIADGGRVEVLWRSSGSWQQVNVPGDQTSVHLVGMQHDDRVVVKVRTVNSLNRQGPSTVAEHTVDGATSVGTHQIADGAATMVHYGTGSGVTVIGVSGAPGTWTTVATVETFTAAVSGQVEIVSDGDATIVTNGTDTGQSDDFGGIYTRLTSNGTSIEGNTKIVALGQVVGLGETVSANLNRSRRMSVTAGVSYTIAMQVQKFSPTSTLTVNYVELRVVEIKK